MDLSLNDDQKLLRSTAREFLAAEWPSAQLRRMLDPQSVAQASDSFWGKVAEMGWPGLLVPEKYEGLGLGMFDLVVLLEETGRRLIPGALFSSGVLAALALEHLGSEEARREYLPAIAEGRLKATLAITDGGAKTGGAIAKRFVPDAAGAGLLLCVLQQNDAATIVIPHGAKIRSLPTLDVTRPLAEVTFDRGAAEPAGEGSPAGLQQVIDRAAIALSAEMLGGAQELLDQTVAYVKTRKQFGVPVGSFQAVQHRAADMAIAIEKARSAVYYAAAVADESPAQLGYAASLAKVAANQTYRFAAHQAIQLHGGLGFTWEQDIHLYFKRAKASEVTFGDNDHHLDRLAAGLGL